ncbi:RNA-binding protein 33-like [Ceratina calcarata]|uniref:RNA-binding protein 33-like n=1 Tax=Ceratina calcarata TaxID=156304 RepID=A0AAJ7J8L3_9HYME|nr:RNA-binding protein 33-like [Ceratina calcarata]
MSEHDDTLLDEDLGDEEYDLGNDEEEALLADDYELERQNSYKGEEETDDVLDLGVTDALDDLDAEDENIEFSRSKTNRSNENDYYEDGDHLEDRSKYYEQDEINEYKSELQRQHDERSTSDSVNNASNIEKGDLREKLQKNAKIYSGNGQGMEDDECEEAKERRNRFQNERIIVSSKMNSHIPDTLESVVTPEPSKLMSSRGRGRGRSARGSRGGRFNMQNSGNFNPRFGNTRNFDNQPPPACRPPLLETRPPFLLPNNIQSQQIIYQQSNSQVQPFQHYSPNGSLQGPPHFVDNRPQFNPNQFQGQPGPRIVGPRLDYGPRGGLPGPAYNHAPSQPSYVQIQQQPAAATAPFQNSTMLMQDNQVPRLMQNSQGPLIQGNPGGSFIGNPNSVVPGGASAPVLPGNQPLPMQPFSRQASSQGPLINHPNVNQIPNQPPFENRPTFQETSQFESRTVYDSRSGYPDQVPTSQFNTNSLPVPQQSASNVPNVPLPPGHKILINPHFRGAVQSSNDARLAWDSPQQAPNPPSQGPAGQFSQPVTPYQNQTSYNQTQQGPSHYQQNYQPNKTDDPYAYFSDVWQENKPQKSHCGTMSKQYPVESSYARDSNYESSSKYKSDQWDHKSNYSQDHRGAYQNYRDRDLSSKTRNEHPPKSRTPSTTTYRDSYDQNHVPKSGNRSANISRSKLPQKRVVESADRPLRDLSPKRLKPATRNLQEVRTVDTLSSTSDEKKDEEMPEDPEMQEYKKKMEEQKRLREKILREKENRRKMAAMEKQNEETKNEGISLSENIQDAKPVSVLMGVVKDVSANKAQAAVGRGRGRPISAQCTEEKQSCVRIVRTIQTSVPDSLQESNSGHATGQMNCQSGARRVVIQKPLSNTQKVVKAQLLTQKTGQPDAVRKVVHTGQKMNTGSQRIVIAKSASNLQKTVINVQEISSTSGQKIVSNPQRVVLQKAPTQQKKVPEIKTNTVRVENLAASTSEAQIRRMCQGIGTIESIQMGERSATIVFKTQSAAMVFHKKYQRKMIDLSLITVRLVPPTGGTKTTAAKVS